jgi:hypothetical protein
MCCLGFGIVDTCGAMLSCTPQHPKVSQIAPTISPIAPTVPPQYHSYSAQRFLCTTYCRRRPRRRRCRPLGNCARWVSRGLLAAGLVQRESAFPKVGLSTLGGMWPMRNAPQRGAEIRKACARDGGAVHAHVADRSMRRVAAQWQRTSGPALSPGSAHRTVP